MSRAEVEPQVRRALLDMRTPDQLLIVNAREVQLAIEGHHASPDKNPVFLDDAPTVTAIQRVGLRVAKQTKTPDEIDSGVLWTYRRGQFFVGTRLDIAEASR